MKKIVKDKKEQNLLRILHDEIPTLAIKSSKLVADSWDNIVLEVNDDYIFRFPKDEDNTFEAEVKTLQFLQGKLSVEIPSILFLGKKYKYIGYRKIAGSILSEDTMASLPQETKRQIANDAAQFLFEFHSSLSVKRAQGMGIKEIRMSTFADQILPTIPNHFSGDPRLVRFAEGAVSSYQKIKSSYSPKRVLHWDLHNENMILDNNHRLKGVIDFGDVEIGDIHADFHPLYKFDREMAAMAMAAYEQSAKLTLSFDKVKVYAWINELSDIAELVTEPHNPAYQRSMKRVLRWINEE